MKILFISHHLRGDDGWSRYARDLILNIKKAGNEVMCLVNEIDKNTDINQKQVLDKGPSSYVSNAFLSYKNSQKVNLIIEEFKPDIIHVIVEPYGHMIPFIKNNKAKIVITVHSTFAYMPILVSGIKRLIASILTINMYKKVDAVISVSKFTEEHLKKYLILKNKLSLVDKKLNIISGGVDEKTIDLNRTFYLNNNPKEVLFVGAIKPRKGLKEAIEALRYVKTNYIYRIVGYYEPQNKYFIELKKIISEYGLDDKIIFTGKVNEDELSKYYKKSDLFLMLSINNGADFEGFGLVYIEANGRGVPVIGPNDSGVSDAVVSGKTGYLVNQFDPQEIAKIIDQILINKTIKPEDCINWAIQNNNINKSIKVLSLYKLLNK